MEARVLILRAGSGASNSLIRSLRAGKRSVYILGCHSDRFLLKKSAADRNYLVPPVDHPQFHGALCRLLRSERVDLLIPNSDSDVRMISDLRDAIPCRLFLPQKSVVDLCQDKFRLATFLHAQGVPVPRTQAVMGRDALDLLFQRLGPLSRYWCRLRSGTGSAGAIPVKTPAQAQAWISFWEEMWGIAPTAFTISEYLPGRCFACQSVWQNGKVILIKTYELLSYLGGEATPSGISSVGSLAKMVFETRLVDTSCKAIRAIDLHASGVFDVDLKEDDRGVARITEINAGRFISGTNLFDLAGHHNMAEVYLRLALGEAVHIDEPYDAAEGYYMVRDIDTVPHIFHADEFFDGIRELSS